MTTEMHREALLSPWFARTSFLLTLAATSFILITSTAYADEQRTMQPSDVANIEAVVEVAISPDGQSVAHVLAVPRNPLKEKDGPYRKSLQVLRPDGSVRRYVNAKSGADHVGWTPDGKHLSFLAKRKGDSHKSLYIIPVDGGEARKVVSHTTNIQSYDWNPDGQRVAFLAVEPKDKKKKGLEDRGFNAKIYEEAIQDTRIWLARADMSVAGVSGRTDAPGGDEPSLVNVPGSASEIHWSPDGHKIVAALAPTSLVDDHYMNRKVSVIHPATHTVRATLQNPGKLGTIRWSPDGSRLAFVAGADRNDPSAGRLMVASASGGPLKDLVPDFDGAVHSLEWQDTKNIIFTASIGAWSIVGSVPVNGGSYFELITTGGPILSHISYSRAGQTAAFRGQTPEHPNEVYVYHVGDSMATRGTHNNLWLLDIVFSKQEVIRYSALDGLEIEGILIQPLVRKKRERVPLIVQVHGGPESHYRNGWLTYYSYPGQVAAGRNMAIFYPNYRGSTGRGVAYSKLSQSDPAGKEFDDIIDGIDYLIETGLVDPKRVASTGGSYGGYASAWAATYFSDRYAAAAVFVGLSDLISKIGTTDIPQEIHLVHYLRKPWDDWMFFLERSPIYHAGKNRTPTLILHGDSDTRVDPGQSKDLYRHLKLRGKAPVRLVMYPGEGHGNRRAASRLDYSLRVLRWLEHYLKGPGGNPPPFELDYDSAMGGGKAAK